MEVSMPKAYEQRLEQVSPLDLCKVTNVIWQDFKLKCEERAKKRIVKSHLRISFPPHRLNFKLKTTRSYFGGTCFLSKEVICKM